MIHVYSLPAQEPVFSNYTVLANGVPVPVCGCRVSAVPFNRRWPGHQRAPEQSEPAYFCRFAADEKVTLTVTADHAFTAAEVRPLDRHITPVRDGNTLTFTLPCCGGFTVEPDGFHNALHIFCDPVASYTPDATYYFGPGVHHPGVIRLGSDETLYIDEGAVVYGSVELSDARRAKIIGRGILDNSENKEEILYEVSKLGDGNTEVDNSRRIHTITLKNCDDCLIEGITIRDSLVYNVAAYGCNGLVVDNIKTIGCWRYNSDGIDLHNCSHCVVKNCFVRTFDDSICVKAHEGRQNLCEDIVIENCVVWCDWDHALEIGAECCAEQMRNIVFRGCHVIHSVEVALDILNVDYAHVHNVTFEDVSVEFDRQGQRPTLQADDETTYEQAAANAGPYLSTLISLDIIRHHEYSGARVRRGRISDIVFRNIRVYSHAMPKSYLHGYDDEHRVWGVRIEGLTCNSTPIKTLEQANILVDSFAQAPEIC